MKIMTRKVAKEGLIQSVDSTRYAILSSLDSAIDSLVMQYNDLKEGNADWGDVLDQLSFNAMKQKGMIAALRARLDAEGEAAMKVGETTVDALLTDGDCCSQDYSDPEDTIISLINNGFEPVVTVAKESIGQDISKDELVDWISEHETVSDDFISAFPGRAGIDEDGTLYADNSVTVSEIQDWIYEHDKLANDYEAHFGVSRDDIEEYIILAKETDDEDEGFLEYRYPDKLVAQGAFFTSRVPVVLLIKDETGVWKIGAMSEECSNEPLKSLLYDQIEMLNV